ncbi:MAG TPA: chalcone isomerase family protein [Gammaproteobacteria bacterium]
MKKMLLAAAFVAFTGSAPAAELAGVTLPDTVELGGQELVLNGMGLREKFWVDVYVGALYLPEPADTAETAINMDGPSRVVMHFVHDAPADKIVDGWKEGFANNNEKAVIDALGERIATFNGFFTEDIVEGQAVVLDYVPGQGTTVSIDGEMKGTIEGADFNRALRAVWLGPKPPSKEFRGGLLGKE